MPVRVNGFEIPEEAIKREAERMSRDVAERFPWLDPTAQKLQAEDMAKDRFIEHRLLFEEAQSAIQNLNTEEVEKEFEKVAKRYGGKSGFLKEFKLEEKQLSGVKREIEEDIKFRRYVDSLNQNLDTPSESETQAFYEENRKRFESPNQYKAAHIVFHTDKGQDADEAKRKAEETLALLQNGESFEELADKVSDCPGKGGDLGWFPDGHMVEEFEDVVFKLGKGEISGVFQTPFGFHIARLDDHKPGELKPFETVKEMIEEELSKKRRDQHFKDVVEELKAKALIER